MRISFLVLSLGIAILAVIFALSNPGYVTLRFGPYQIEQSIALVVLISFALGVLVALLATIPGRVKRTREIRRLRKQVGQATSTSGMDPMTENP